MCGIAGYIGFKKLSDRSMNSCLAALQHRGPDGSGRFVGEKDGRHVCLLHTRLSILDLDERSAQPMRRQGRAFVFNGELYNYLEIRERLETAGCVMKTSGDTEVFLEALSVEGLATLDGCEGMWGFALYNEADGSLVLCRDRFGEKPLYYCEDETGLYFASEIKAIVALRGKPFMPNLHHVRRFLVNGYKSLYKQPGGFFHEVEEVPAGASLTIGRGGQKKLKRYWYPQFRPETDMTFEEAVNGAREHLMRSMEIRLRSDVPLAFCQSGGVDSSALISIAKRIFNYDVHGFTVVSKDARYDEWDIVQESIAELGLKHTSILLDTEDFLSNLRELVRGHDAPVYTITYYAHWLLMRSVAEQGFKVSISGSAADELFAGYYDHQSMYLAAMYGTADYETALSNWKQHIKPIVRNPLLQDPVAFVNNPGQREHIYLDNHKYASYLTNEFNEGFIEEQYCDELLRNRMLNELFHEATPVILHEDDMNAMFFSVENRSPFLDRNLFDFCNSIPTRLLIQNGCNKSVLREAMRGIMPNRVVEERRKVGFNASLFEFINPADPETRDELLRDSPVFDVVQRDAVEQMLNMCELRNCDNKFLFSFIGTKMFLEEWS